MKKLLDDPGFRPVTIMAEARTGEDLDRIHKLLLSEQGGQVRSVDREPLGEGRESLSWWSDGVRYVLSTPYDVGARATTPGAAAAGQRARPL